MKTQDAELLAWAAAKIQSAQEAGVYGTVTVFLEGGRITRSETKQLDKPGLAFPENKEDNAGY